MVAGERVLWSFIIILYYIILCDDDIMVASQKIFKDQFEIVTYFLYPVRLTSSLQGVGSFDFSSSK